jgi:hypothetical protein
MTLRSLEDIEELARSLCVENAQSEIAEFAASACGWLHACGYQGLPLLKEALADDVQSLSLVRDSLGLDLHNVSCVFLAPSLDTYVKQHGRVFLRNVRHGLFLVPQSVNNNYGIGCPVDPSFALGGERSKNPYEEKLAAARMVGVEIADEVWANLLERP